MTDILLEVFRALVVGIILLSFFQVRDKKEISSIDGWPYIVLGFGFLFFAVLIDITDNFEQLNRFVVIGDTEVQAFLEKVVGYLFGFLFIAYGIWKWLPRLLEYTRSKDQELRVSRGHLSKMESSLREAQELAHLGNWDLDLATGQASWSDEEFRLLGYEPGSVEPSAENFMRAVHPDDVAAVQAEMQRAMDPNETRPYRIEHRVVYADGFRVVDQRGKVSFNETGQPLRMFGTTMDITDRKQAEERIEFLAHHDSLTSLPNRYSLNERLEQSIRSARRRNLKQAVIFIDLDNFKLVNDTLGHNTGDKLLIEIAQRLKGQVRESDIVSRLGGDEFVVVLTCITQAMEAAPVVEKIFDQLNKPIEFDGYSLTVSPSIGVSIYPDDGMDGDTLMKHADTAMYHAKKLGRNNIQFFEKNMNIKAMERVALERDLRAALANNELEVYYQPQVIAVDGKVYGVEALARWQHPKLGFISPEKFISIAEESGLIVQLGQWVLDQSCRQLSKWHRDGLNHLRVAVNLSAHQLRSPELTTMISETLQRHRLDGSDLELEVTESTAMSNPDNAIKQLQALRDLGVTLAIDDFGTGYSSLALLKNLPVQILKLDREFVRDIETDDNDAAISSATLALSHELGLKVVAEGVENQNQRDFLLQQNCDFFQGYLFGKPEPAEALTKIHQHNQQKS